jgi:YidC/Oxa1 family membrane protein insertase
MENNRNFFITIALSVLILVLWQVFYMNPRIEAQREATKVEQQRQEETQAPAANAPGSAAQPDVPGAAAPSAAGAAQPVETREQALAANQRVKIDTPSLIGSINLTGARIDDLVLRDYHETVDDDSPNIHLLSPAGLQDAYYVELGYTGAAAGELPGPGTVWSVEGNPTLTPSTPVTLTYTNDAGLTFTRTFSVDEKYMFTVDDKVTNASGQPVTLSSYGRTTRYGTPPTQGTYVLHEGLIGVTGDEGLQEIKYKTLKDDKQVVPSKSTDGWLGITDKYWAVALVPPTTQPFQPRFSYFDDNDKERYQADYLTDALTVGPGETVTLQSRFFAGAKQVEVVDGYKDQYNINRFDRLIDWGWFYFITKPMFWLIDHLYKLFGNFGLAIIATTVIVKAIFFPLANKSYKSMANMKKVQPAMAEIREKYADDKMKQQQAMMELYKKEKINPVAGCWPVALQIPVFFSLYKVLYVTIEMRHAPFFGWIQDLAAPDPTSIFNLFGLLPYTPPAILPHLGVWAVVMGITMFLQMRMQPTPPDPTQAMIFTWMPVVFTFMMAGFPAGLVIYWAWNNTLSIVQQGVIMKRQGVKIELWDNLAGMFRRKPKPAE